MKFYCTKYWATTGIIEFEGELYREQPNSVQEYAAEGSYSSLDGFFLRIGTDAFLSLDEAWNDVEHKAHLNLHSKERALQKAKELLRKATEKGIKVVKR